MCCAPWRSEAARTSNYRKKDGLSLHQSAPINMARNVMRLFCGTVVLVIFTTVLAAPSHTSAQSRGRSIDLGEARTIHSAVLAEDREVLIALPETYGRTSISYPVLFLLDGSSHLLHATATARFLASARNRIPEMIVVAIPNTNRNRDLTPGPGATKFQRFLGDELIPWVETNYRAASERILFGHSLSASFAVHTLLNRAELFDVYVAASPPLWRYDGLAGDTTAGLGHAGQARAALYLTVGEHENDRLREGVERFAAVLKAGDSALPGWSYVLLKDEDHSSTPHRSIYNALEARYAEWRFKFFEDLTELDAVGGLKGLEAHYERFSKRFGYRAPPPEDRLLQVGRIYVAAERHQEVMQLASAYLTQYPAMAENLINQVGYDQLRRGQLVKAVQTFKRNVELFPNSPNVHDSLGDAYCRTGDSGSARRSYQQAAQVAKSRTPQHPRLGFYEAKAKKGCDS